jgi:hypothetical protein
MTALSASPGSASFSNLHHGDWRAQPVRAGSDNPLVSATEPAELPRCGVHLTLG